MAIRSIFVLIALSVVSTAAVTLVDRSEAGEASTHSRFTGSATRPTLTPPAPRLARRDLTPGTTRVPILMYHVLGDPPGGAPFPELYVRRSDFVAQMRWLERNGYQAVTLRAVWDQWHGGAPLPARPVVVSFDDGYREVAESALPVMRERNWPGIVNLSVKNLAVSGGLSERLVRRLIGAGWEIDAHTVTHPDLTAVAGDQLTREIGGSRIQIQRRFGVRVDFFCYPAGRYDARVIAAVKRAGFLGATTTLEGLAAPAEPFTLRRVRVSRSDGLAGLMSSLERLS